MDNFDDEEEMTVPQNNLLLYGVLYVAMAIIGFWSRDWMIDGLLITWLLVMFVWVHVCINNIFCFYYLHFRGSRLRCIRGIILDRLYRWEYVELIRSVALTVLLTMGFVYLPGWFIAPFLWGGAAIGCMIYTTCLRHKVSRRVEQVIVLSWRNENKREAAKSAHPSPAPADRPDTDGTEAV